VRTYAEAAKKANENVAKAQDASAAAAEQPDDPPPSADEVAIDLDDL
jgi:hypothetical protein